MTEQTRYKYTDTNRASGNSCVWWSVIRPWGKSTSSGYPGIHKPDRQSLHSSLVLAIVVRLESVWLSVWTGVLYTGNRFKLVELIQVMS